MVHGEMRPTTKVRDLAAFDLDWTLPRGPTVCEILARPLGRIAEMQRLESLQAEIDFRTAREEMPGWYKDTSLNELVVWSQNTSLKSGAD
jgi:hypothetical protein